MIDGDSCYNRRHKQGHFKGQQIPFGALVDFMPQPDTKVESIGSKTFPGVFIGYHIHPGGLWSNDYLVAELSSFKENFNVAWSKVKVHRIREVVANLNGKFYFPVARWRRAELLNYSEHGLPTDPDMPGLEKDSSDDEELPPRAAGSSTDLPNAAADVSSPITLLPAEAAPRGELLSANTDTRGLGLETFAGRGGVRKSKNTSRPPYIMPELWGKYSKKKKDIAIAEYEQELADTAAAARSPPREAAAAAISDVRLPSPEGVVPVPACAAESVVPMLPREFRPTEQGPHRVKN
jgi:hypothetical protein